jgi:hypothetical protein
MLLLRERESRNRRKLRREVIRNTVRMIQFELYNSNSTARSMMHAPRVPRPVLSGRESRNRDTLTRRQAIPGTSPVWLLKCSVFAVTETRRGLSIKQRYQEKGRGTPLPEGHEPANAVCGSSRAVSVSERKIVRVVWQVCTVCRRQKGWGTTVASHLNHAP